MPPDSGDATNGTPLTVVAGPSQLTASPVSLDPPWPVVPMPELASVPSQALNVRGESIESGSIQVSSLVFTSPPPEMTTVFGLLVTALPATLTPSVSNG